MASFHTPRLEARRGALRSVFSKENMAHSWKKYVRSGFRRQELFDLFDYNDFHWNRETRFADLERAIVAGRYRPNNSIPIKVEKALGVCRTIVVPNPEDAVVLQCIVEKLLPIAMRRQPSKNTFFSRSHAGTTGSFEFDRDYIWFKEWRKFSRVRIELSSAHRWLVTTDISTFFDNVRHPYLRNIISSFDGQDEVILDILISILDHLNWKPDYLPSSSIGLPQVQFDAPRLLAHIYLFEIDEYIKQRTSDQFVRWVDDMTIAVSSREEAKAILRDLDAILQIRGLRLNSGKTKILSAAEASRFFHQSENRKIDQFEAHVKKNISKNLGLKGLTRRIGVAFRSFRKQESIGHSEKVLKRYVGLAALLKSDFAVKFMIDNFCDTPGMRDVFYRYIHDLGPRDDVFEMLQGYLKSKNALDDASVYHVSQVFVDWEMKSSHRIFKSLRKLAKFMMRADFVGGSPHRFSAALSLSVKYASERDLVDEIRRSQNFWTRSEYLSRQVCASTGRVRDPKFLDECANVISGHAYKSAISVAEEIRKLRGTKGVISKSVRGYINNGKNPTTYKIHRLLVALSVLRSPRISSKLKSDLKKEICEVLQDPFYASLVKRC